MITINPTEHDDPQFVELVARIVDSAVQIYCPGEIYVVQIDHWFDFKWKAFSGKVLGGLGVWRWPLTLPPFHPHRVMSQVHYEADSPAAATYVLRPGSPLHIDQWSESNMKRFLRRLSKSGLFVWYSGRTAESDAASLMLYRVNDGQTAQWYASFRKKEGWQLNKVEGISRREFSALLESSPSPRGI